jgi:hypothetical protein
MTTFVRLELLVGLLQLFLQLLHTFTGVGHSIRYRMGGEVSNKNQMRCKKAKNQIAFLLWLLNINIRFSGLRGGFFTIIYQFTPCCTGLT